MHHAPRARGARIALAIAVLATSLASSCSAAVNGTGSAAGPTGFPSTPRSAPAAPSSAVPFSSATAPSPPATSPTTAPGTITAAQLPQRLMVRPAGAVAWTSAWARNVTPTVEQFVTTEYVASVRAEVIAQLRSEGLTAIAHRTWFAKDTNQADVILLRFNDRLGALHRWSSATLSEGSATGSAGFRVPGVPQSLGYHLPHVDRVGNVRTIVYVPVRNVVIEFFYYSHGRFQPADALRWVRTQYDRLR